MIYAHTKEGAPPELWEPLYGPNGHAELTAKYIRSFGDWSRADLAPALREIAEFLALTHDMGKASPAFQRHLLGGESADHKTAAALLAHQQENCLLKTLLPYTLYGHHVGLPDGTDLFAKLKSTSLRPDVRAAMPASYNRTVSLNPAALMAGITQGKEAMFTCSMLVRMLHSCLVDADWSATEAFCDPNTAQQRAAHDLPSLQQLQERLETFLSEREHAASGPINELRARIHARCRAAGAESRGVYRLLVPTGGGKTFSSLSFALEHAIRQGLHRVIYVIPYTSIIEQTAKEFRAVLGDDAVVEHHSNLAEENDREANRFASENWDAPLIVTTNVQFFESLFSAAPKRCRKLHNIGRSVIIFDEAQALPPEYLAPCLAALKSLQRLCDCTLVLCTATQPALVNRPEEGFDIGWQPGEVRSLLGESMERELQERMKRVRVEPLGNMSLQELAQHFVDTGHDSALFIVNLTRQAQDLYRLLEKQGAANVFHLSARMCPAHRTAVLDAVRERLSAGLPTILVSTRVVEAGVDVSFPIVYRDACGLDSLAQAAGRCNRHGELPMGAVYSFNSTEYSLPSSFVTLRDAVAAWENTLPNLGDKDWFSSEAVESYFRHFYWQRGASTGHWDAHGIQAEIGHQFQELETIPFRKIASLFRLIDAETHSVMVPYGPDADKLAEHLRELNRAGQMPSREIFRKIQQFTVSVYDTEAKDLPCEILHEKAGVYLMNDTARYNTCMGLLREPPNDNYIQ